MLGRIKGKITLKTKERLLLETGGLTYEIMTPPIISSRIDEATLDGQVQLVILNYFLQEKKFLKPLLIGFLNELERDFFELFITVSGIGPKAALKALERPISEIAEAIDNQDVGYLKRLPGIGERRAYQILAGLKGKVSRFRLIPDKGKETVGDLENIINEVVDVLLQLQYTRKEAAQLIKKVLEKKKDFSSSEEMLNYIYKLR